MKKILLGLGTLGMIATPLAAVISCGSAQKHEMAKEFIFGDSTAKQELNNFVNVNKGKEVVIKVEMKDYKFISDGTLPSGLNTDVDKYIARVEADKKLQQAAQVKAAKEAAAKIAQWKAQEKAQALEKATSAEKDILKTDIIDKVKQSKPYLNTNNVDKYDIPTSITLTKEGVDFNVAISNVSKDENKGVIIFDASITTTLITVPRELSSVALTGFKINLDNEHKIVEVQAEMDANDSLTLTSCDKTSTESTESDIKSHIQEIVINNFGLSPEVENIKKLSGKVTFDLSYEADDADGTKHIAKKTITILGMVSDVERANKIQGEVDNWVNEYVYSEPTETPISQDDPRIIAGEFKVTKTVAGELGLPVNFKDDLFKSYIDIKISIDPTTLIGEFSVKYNGVDSTVNKIPMEVNTLEKQNFKTISERRTFKEGQVAVPIPASFKFPKGLTELPQMALSGYEIPGTFKLPDTLTKIDHGAFFGADIAEGVTLPDTVTSIGSEMFMYAKVPASMTIPESIDFLPNALFREATIADGYALPKKLQNFGEYAFYFAKIGKNFKMPEEMDAVADNPFVEVTFGDGLILPKHIKLVNMRGDNSSGIFSGATMPSYIDVSNIKIDKVYCSEPHSTQEEIIDMMFEGSSTTDHLVPNYVTHLRSGVLNDISVDKGTDRKPLPDGFTIPSNIKYIDSRAFYRVDLTKGLVIPDSVIEIGDEAFEASILPKAFTLPSHLEKIGMDAFTTGGFSQSLVFPAGFAIPDSVTSIGDGAFFNADFSAGMTIGSGVTELTYATFAGAEFSDDFKLPTTITKLIDEPFKKAKVPTGFDGGSKVQILDSGTVSKSTVFRMSLLR